MYLRYSTTMKLFYVRHGKTQGNSDKNYIGRMESPLLPEGIEGGKHVGRHIRQAGERIDAIYTSAVSRQYETARLIATEIGYPEDKIIVTDLLFERAGGTFEGKPQAEFFAVSEAEQIAAGAESLKELSNRASALISQAKTEYPSGTVLFVGSATIGEMIRAMITYNDFTKIFDDDPLPNSEFVQFI